MSTVDHTSKNGKSTKTKDDRISVRWKYCSRFPVENPTQRAILTVIGENADADQTDSYISKLTVAERIHASRSTVYRTVKRMEAIGILIAEDAGSTTHWMLPPLAELRAFAKHIQEKDKAAKQEKQAAKRAAKQRPTIPEEMQSEETSPVQSDMPLGQSDMPLGQSDTPLCQPGTQSGSLSGEQSGIISGDGKAGDSASSPDVPNTEFFSEFLEDPKTKTKAGEVLIPEVMPELSVGDEEAAQHQHYDVTSPAGRTIRRQVGKVLTLEEQDEEAERMFLEEQAAYEAEQAAIEARRTAP